MVLYFTTEGTWDLTKQRNDGGWSGGFYQAQAESMLVRGRLDVQEPDIQGECFERRRRCYGYFGLTPSLVRIPLLGISRSLHSSLTPVYLGLGVLLAYWAALQLLQRALRRWAGQGPPHALILGYAAIGALALGPGSTLMFITRPAVYEEASAWGVAFLLLALNRVWAWFEDPATSLVPAVLFGIAAVNARPTAATACGVLGIVSALLFVRRERGPARRIPVAALCLALLPGLTAAGVFWLKLGTPVPSLRLNKQVQEAPHWKAILERNGDRTAGLMFTPTALAAYFRPDALVRRPEWPFYDFRFPDKQPLLWLPPLPEGGAYVERVASVTSTMPLPWGLTLVAAIWLGVQARKLNTASRPGSSSPPSVLTTDQLILAAGLLVSAAATALLTVTTAGITNRYLLDFYAMSAVGVALAPQAVLPLLGRRPAAGAAAEILALLLVAWSIVVALSLNTHLVFD